jgi:hypothetical protein
MKKRIKISQVMGLRINTQKTKYMEVTKRPTNTKTLKRDGRENERVKEFKYLKAILTECNYITTEIKQRTIMANKTSCALKKQLNSPIPKRRLNVRCIKPL